MANHNFSIKPKAVPIVKTKNRIINSFIPAPGTEEILQRLDCVESRSMHGQLPVVWDKAEGFYVYDHMGNKWIDFTSTIFVANIGHSNKKLISNLKASLEKPLISSYSFSNEIRAEYLERLIKFSGNDFDKAFLLSAGTEATEAAFKLMRMNGQKIGKKRLGIVCIEGNWHGRTMGAQMLSSNKKQKEWIGFQDKDIHHIPFPYPWIVNEDSASDFFYKAMKKLQDNGINFSTDICGFMLETFQGWGAIFYPKAFVSAIYELCKKNKILLTFDEMQSGFARTGKAFGYMHYDVIPDLICCGKGMGGGFPISGVLGRADVMDLPEVGNMSSTHSAGPLACAAGLSVLDVIESENLINETSRKGNILTLLLNNLKSIFPDRIAYVLNKGLIGSIIFQDPITKNPDQEFASAIAEKCMQKGLLVVHTGRESIKIGPPLVISDEALEEGIEVIKESIEEISSK
jgi:4-aminobutyrate aminotransferase-like enzyme